MKIQFQENEFTRTDILQFITKAYGRQLNGNRFTIHNLNNWSRMGKIPDAYGGFRILSVEKYPIGKGIKIYTLQGLTRDIAKDIDLLPNKTPTTKRIDKRTTPRKLRTQYYYDILAKHGKQHTTKTLADSILPDNWKEQGIKQNQLKHKKK